MTSPAAAARSRERIAEICNAGLDARTLRVRLLEPIREVVGFSAYAWLLTDPLTTVGSSPLADVPCLPELPNLIRLKYLTPVNRWTTIGQPPIATLHRATGGDPSRSLLWRDLLRRYDVIDLASIVFGDRFGCWGFLDLWRDGTDVPFTAAEAAFLASIVEPVTATLRRSQADTFSHPRPLGDRPGPVVLLLAHDLQVLRQTPPTRDYLQILVPPAPDRAAIPASAYNAAAQLLAVEAGVDPNPPSARVHLADGVWLTLRPRPQTDCRSSPPRSPSPRGRPNCSDTWRRGPTPARPPSASRCPSTRSRTT